MRRILCNNSKVLKCLFFVMAMLLAVSVSTVAMHAERADAPRSITPTLQLQFDHTYVYTWHADLTARYHGTGVLDAQGQITEEATEENISRLHGIARVTVVDELVPGEYLMALKVVAPTFTYLDEDNNEVQEVDETLNQELERPVFFKQNNQGIVTEFHFFPGEDPAALNIKKGIISALQTNLLGDTGGVFVTSAAETDASGTYTPRYSCLAEGEFLNMTMNRNQDDYSAFSNGMDPQELRSAVTIDENVTKRFNNTTGVIEEVMINSHIVTRGEADQDPLEDGAFMWSESLTANTLHLDAVESNSESFSMDGYMMSPLVAEDTVDIDEEPVPTTAEALLRLGADPYDPKAYDGLVSVLCSNPSHVELILTSLKMGAITSKMYPAVIGALGALGTPEAQEILIQEIVMNPGISTITQSQAVVALGLMKEPTEGTVSILEMLANQKYHELSSQATLMLGSAAEKLVRSNPDRAAIIVKNLEFSLISAEDDLEIDLYLGAIGNAGFDSSLDAIGIFLNHRSSLIRRAAVEALRKVYTPEVNTYLRRVLASESEESIRDAAQRILTQRTAAGDDISRPMTTYGWSWEKKIGKGDVYGKVYANLNANNNSGNDNFYISAEGEAKGFAWSWNFSLARAKAWSEVVNISGTLKRRFIAKAYLLGSEVYSTGYKYLTCGVAFSGTMWNQTLTFFNVSYSFYPYGIKVTVGVKASGTVKMDYAFGLNACNAPINVSAYATATPSGTITASGYASVSVYLAKAGVTLYADLLSTTIPTTLQAISQTVSPYFRVNFNSILNMQPISGGLKLWAKIRKWSGWKTVYTKTLWTFSSSTYSTTLINIWY